MRAAVALALALAASGASAQTARIVLRWKEVPGAGAYELQIAKDSTFVDVVLQTRTTTAGYRWDQIPATTHWWRVRSFDADARPSEWSAPRTIAVDSVVPEVKRPEEQAVLPCGASVEVELAASPLIREYLLELSSSSTFQAAREWRGTQPTFNPGVLGAGAWYLRTRAKDLKGQLVGPGPTRPFFVRAVAPRLKAAPEVQLGVPQVQLAWSSVACAKSWLIEVVNDAHERLSLDSREPSLAFKPAAAGDYRWRVAAVDDSGTGGDWSAESVLKVRLPSPALRPEVVTTRAELAWGAVSTATSYRVDVFAAQDPARPKVSSTVTVPQWRTPDLEAGRYTWRVQARDARGHVSAWSELRLFERKPLIPLPIPSVDSVADVGLGEPVVVRWAAVEGAAAYEVSIDGSSQGVVTERSFSSLPLLEGWHTVQVRALNRPLRESAYTRAQEVFVGVPPVVAGKVAIVGDEVRLTLLDKRGLPVRAADPKVEVRGGALSGGSSDAGQWKARWLSPVDGRGVLVVSEREFTQEFPLAAEAPQWLWVAGGVGGVFNGGAVASVSGALAVGGRLPWFARRAGVELRGEYLSASGRLNLDGLTLTATSQVVTTGLLVGWQQPLGAYVLRGAVGPTLDVVMMTVNEARQTRAVPGFEVAASLGRSLGPGRFEVEAAFSYARFETSLARLNVGGLALRIGYSLDVGPR